MARRRRAEEEEEEDGGGGETHCARGTVGRFLVSLGVFDLAVFKRKGKGLALAHICKPQGAKQHARSCSSNGQVTRSIRPESELNDADEKKGCDFTTHSEYSF